MQRTGSLDLQALQPPSELKQPVKPDARAAHFPVH
jgi:hypothetical protein